MEDDGALPPGTYNWPSAFDAEAPEIPFAEPGTDDPHTKPVTWLMVEACLTQPLHVCLTKAVYHQLLESLDNLSYSEASPRPSSRTPSRKGSRVELSTGETIQVGTELLLCWPNYDEKLE